MEVNGPWLITSELANKRAWKVLFTCVVYTKKYDSSPHIYFNEVAVQFLLPTTCCPANIYVIFRHPTLTVPCWSFAGRALSHWTWLRVLHGSSSKMEMKSLWLDIAKAMAIELGLESAGVEYCLLLYTWSRRNQMVAWNFAVLGTNVDGIVFFSGTFSL